MRSKFARSCELERQTGGLLVSVRFSDHGRFPIVVRFLVIILIVIIDIIVVGVPRWRRANQGARHGHGGQETRIMCVDRWTFDGRSSS